MSGYSGALLSMGHREHPLLGQLVADHEGRTGILRAVAPDVGKGTRTSYAAGLSSRSELDQAEPVAWLQPKGGGVEWPAPVDAIRPA